eukprot:4309703-Heterocapsa_arctica.AAC.2
MLLPDALRCRTVPDSVLEGIDGNSTKVAQRVGHQIATGDEPVFGPIGIAAASKEDTLLIGFNRVTGQIVLDVLDENPLPNNPPHASGSRLGKLSQPCLMQMI